MGVSAEYGSLFHLTGPRWVECVALGTVSFVWESDTVRQNHR